jgi:hypothetical protein
VTSPTGSRLGIDFGTTHTVAALAGRDGRGELLLFDASFLLPSAVYAENDGRLLVGRDAERSARLDPTRFEPNPKRRIDDGSVLLGTREFPVADLIAAVLRRTADEAARVAGSMPASVVLTYPANWAASRKATLADAAARAGMPGVTLVPEPIAAALYFTGVLGRVVPPGAALVGYDFGGGTFDTSVLRRRPDGGWDVIASDGLSDVGGLDLDAAIIDHLGTTIGASDPGRWQQLTSAGDEVARRRYRMLWDEVRAAKEQLSRSSSASVHVPLFDTDVYLTRDEFERVARPYLERTADLTAATMQRAGVRPDQVAGLFPVGGSSRIPLVNTLLHHRIGVAPTLIEQPELVVALGSLQAVLAPPGARAPGFAPPAPGFAPPPPGFAPPAAGPPPGTAAPPVFTPPVPVSPFAPTPVSATPVSPFAPTPVSPVSPSPVSATPVSPSLVSAAPISAAPVSPSPVPPFPVSPAAGAGATGTDAPVSGPPEPAAPAPLWPPQPPPATPGAVPGISPGMAPPRRRGRWTLPIAAAVAVLLLIAAGIGGVELLNRTSGTHTNNGPSGNSRGNNPGGNAPSGGASIGSDLGGGQDAKPGARQQSATVNKTIWYAGLKITFGTVSYDADKDPQLSVETVMENLGDKDVRPDIDIVFSAGGQTFNGRPREFSTTVASGQKSNVHLDFQVLQPINGSIMQGTFTIGRGDEAQAVVPVGSGNLVAYEPKVILTDKKVVAGTLTVVYTKCELRGGFTEWHGQAKRGNAALTCLVDIQCPGGCASGKYVGEETFRLGLPDGTEVGPTVAPNEALYSANVVPNTYLGYMIKWPAPGAYILRVVNIPLGQKRSPANTYELPITL